MANCVISVSQGVADDFMSICPQLKHKVVTVPNPTIPRKIHELANEPSAHPWLSKDRRYFVILGVGRFTRRKDFATLIRAFSELRAQTPCHLILLGDGAERPRYLRLADELNVTQDIDLPGDVQNPYAFMARADLFVLSSYASEGSPNALKEALALGLPVVSTDCPSGPREILGNGEYGKLVPPQDPTRLAEAMLETLMDPPSPERLKAAVSEYAVQTSVEKYLDILLPDRK
jgi:glycosyltransferase involved in cell wall biosynthesis